MKKIVDRQRVQIEDLHVEIQELNKKMSKKERYEFENPKELIEKILESIPEITNLTVEFGNLLESVPQDNRQNLVSKLAPYYNRMVSTVQETVLEKQTH